MTERAAAIVTDRGRIPGPRGMDLWRFLSSLSDRPQERFLELALRYGRCIGFRFAQLEGQVILATLAQSFSVRLKPGQEVVPEARLNLPPRDGVHLYLEPRRTPATATAALAH